MSLRLEPMTDEDVRAFVVEHLDEYVTQIEHYGGWSHEDAVAKAEKDMAATFPDGRAQADHRLFHLVVEDGERVGILWYAQQERGVWLYQVTVDEAHRGRGLGRAAMQLLEEEARALGVPRIELNVFGGNEAARSLYRSLGFREDAVVMSKPIESR